MLVELRHRAGLTVREVAAKIGKSRQAVHVAEKRPHHASMDVIMAIAHACGATPKELDLLPALTAMDKGALVVPVGTTVERVGAAMRCLEGCARVGTEPSADRVAA
jgi:DNA-binding XRE family transcriptional regulator